MPYQAAKEKNSKHVSTESLDQQVETDEQAAENTVHGADLLLSLTKGSTCSTNAMVTPKDPTSNNTSTGSLESSTTSCGSGMRPPVTTAEIYQRNNHFPRMLYHSPIKISTSATTTSNELSRSNKADGVSGELAPYTMVPAWSPSLYNGMVYPTAYGRSPIYNHHQHSSSIEPDENRNGKRSANKIEEKKETEDGTVCARKQRLISPSSSNEKPEEESPPDSLSSEKKKKTSWNLHAPQRPRMYNMPPHWSHQLPYPPPPHMVYPHPPPHYQMYAPYPPPWAMYAPPPPHPSNNILPPPVRRHPSPPRASTTTDSALTHDTNARHVSNESIPNDSDDRESPCPSRDESLNRCIPLKHPIPKRSWSAASIERKLPDFSLLVNFPDHLSKGRGVETNASLSSDGTKPCVMCGELRLCSAGIASNSSGTGRRPRTTLVPSPDDPQSAGAERTAHIIPRQNKGVCTVCDVAVWLVRDHDNLEIKWCKGCKNFRPWAAFGDKGLATKCVRCRKRQKEKYATQKVSGQTILDTNEDAERRSSIVAVNGLRQLMKSSPM